MATSENKRSNPSLEDLNYQDLLAVVTLCNLECEKLAKYIRGNSDISEQESQFFQDKYRRYAELSFKLEEEVDRRFRLWF